MALLLLPAARSCCDAQTPRLDLTCTSKSIYFISFSKRIHASRLWTAPTTIHNHSASSYIQLLNKFASLRTSYVSSVRKVHVAEVQPGCGRHKTRGFAKHMPQSSCVALAVIVASMVIRGVSFSAAVGFDMVAHFALPVQRIHRSETPIAD